MKISIQEGDESDDIHVDIDHLLHHTRLPHTAFSVSADNFVRRVGETISWVWIVLLAVIILNVTVRYVFDQGRIEFEEIQWHLYAMGFLVALSYCFEADSHVRVDIFHERMTLRNQAWVEMGGILFLLLPFISMVIYFAVPFVAYSWVVSEASDAPSGLPARWAIKSFMVTGFILLGLATLSRLTRVASLLFGFPKEISVSD
ncbi:MAG: TRAP transporter small permease subunit [Aestuariibacter sp.]|nr:TRAP transporter small permease subunit [Aestuariibacter sp.]